MSSKLNYKILVLLVLLGSGNGQVLAQSAKDRVIILERTNISALESIATKANEKYLSDMKEASLRGIEKTTRFQNGSLLYFHSFNRSGEPIYYQDDNLQIARTSRVETLWRGGDSGFELTGSGIEVGLWETGVPLGAHQDLLGKVTIADNEAVSSHATHTAGTIAGSGMDSEARGMAKNVKIFSRNSQNDESEMAVFAMNGGILSNHSYRFSNPEDENELYGVYNEFSSKWDNIAYNAPFYTICKSGGNQRNDGNNEGDGGYDLMYNNSCSKNVLVVAASRNVPVYNSPLSVIPASFSNYGPTDDWRIKPDITTNGVDIYSCDSGNTLDYDVKSGTSMSSAAVAGIIALLQEHYHNINNIYMMSSTVRALVIATADEAGSNPGPDFQSGWGLLNAENAAYTIVDDGLTSKVEEWTLDNGDSISIEIEVDGSQSFRAAIAWTDPAGEPFFLGEDNTKSALVNDLDIRLIGEDGVYEPWVLTPNEVSNNFRDAASKGDNYRDNCERIDVEELEAGQYTLQIKHKNELVKGRQDFSLVVNGLANSSSVNEETQDPFGFNLYPVPVTNGLLNIDLANLDLNEVVDVSIFSIDGILQKKLSQINENTVVDVSSYRNGVYVVALQNSKHLVRKLVSVVSK